jgi:hypothetical protein
MSDMNKSKALEILGLKGDPSPAAVKKAYREQVKLWHPDRYSAGSTMKTMAEKNIQDANLAYAFLKRRNPQPSRGGFPDDDRETRHRVNSPPRRSSDTPFRRAGLGFRDAIDRFAPGRVLARVMRWLRNDPRNRFRPWYRYPDSGDAAGGPQKRAADFNRTLQDAMHNRAALKRLHRARRRSSDSHAGDKATPVESAPKPGPTDRRPPSEGG